MSGTGNNNGEGNQEENQNQQQQLNDDNIFNDSSIPDSVKTYLRSLRTENATHRTSNKELQKTVNEYNQLKSEQQKKTEEEAIKNGEAVKVLEGTKAENESLKSEIKRLKAIEDIVVSTLDERVKALPKGYQDLMPEDMNTEAKIKWITKAEKSAKESEGSNQQQQQGNQNAGRSNGRANDREQSRQDTINRLIASGKYYG